MPELPVADDTEDDVTERMTRIVPVAAPSVLLPPARRTPVRLRKPEVLPVADDTEDEPTDRMARIVPVARPARMPLPGPRTPVRLRHSDSPRAITELEGADFAEPISAPDDPTGILKWATDRIRARGTPNFGDAYTIAREQAAVEAREMLDPNDVPLEAKEAIAELEGELEDEIAALSGAATKTRVTIAEKGMRALEGTLYFVKNGVPELAKTGLELLNLDTKEKAYAALLEIIPTMSFWYAVTGKRIKFQEGKGLSQPEFESIDKVDRALYALGTVFFFGHLYSGVRNALVNKGVFALARQGKIFAAARALLPEMSKLVGPTIARAQQYGIRQLTEDRNDRSPKSDVRS